ncbi:MAG TPA: hypothetical protein PKW69_01875 [Niabella sp.]|nr:hypothetical protein [Niabella sp.]
MAGINASHAQTISGYRVTGARVIIKTGNDNKEWDAKVNVFLFPIPPTIYTMVTPFGQKNLTNEMKVNSNTDFGLTELSKQRIPWPVYNSRSIPAKLNRTFPARPDPWLVEDLQKSGFRLLVCYRPFSGWDAWKIDKVTVQLEIKKQDGTPHPTLSGKTVVFNITSPPLGFGAILGTALVCETDKNLVPTTHYLTRDVCIDY